jgi:signal transduction histidine kinase
VVAHQLSAIAVQAGAARIATGSPDAGGPNAGGLGTTAEVLARLEQLSREALAELIHLLGALRRDPDAAADMPPAPTLAGLDALIASASQAGVPAELAVQGRQRSLSPGGELSGYRIVAEALANVARHAPGATARVVLCYTAERLEITVRNTAPPPGHHRPAASRPGAKTRPGLGLGVRGMRERAELYGGTLDAGPCPDGGFLVTAALPYGTAAGTEAGAGPGHQAGAGAGQQAGREAGRQAGDEAAPTAGPR